MDAASDAFEGDDIEALHRLAGLWTWVQDADGRFVQVSDHACDAIGAPATSLIGKTWSDAGFRTDAASWDRLAEARSKRRPFQRLPLWRPITGAGIYACAVSGAPATDANGAHAGFRGVCLAATPGDESQLRDVLERSPMGVVVLAHGPFTRLFHNSRLEELLLGDSGVGIDDIQGADTFVDPEDYHAMFEAARRGERVVDRTVERVRPDGARWSCLLNAGPIRFEGQDAVIVWIYDITDRVRAETALKASQARTLDILESTSSGVSIWRKQPLERIYANHTMLDLYRVKDLAELNAHGFKNMGVSDNIVRRALNLSDPNEALPRYVEERFRPDGSSFWIMSDMRRIEFDGEDVIISWLNDITEQKRAEQSLDETLAKLRLAQEELVQSARLASLGELVAGMAHEINTPLGVAMTAISTVNDANAALQKDLDAGALTRSGLANAAETFAEGLDLANANLERTARLVRSFKAIAVDQSSEARRPFDFRDYVADVAASLAPLLRGTGHRTVVSGKADIILDSYPGAWAQILTNLISNSVQHAYPDGRAGRIDITVEASDGKALLTYSDDGQGMSEADLKRIYDPFFTTRRAKGGNGLGMSVVYTLAAKRLGGSIQARSAPGAGLEVVIETPLTAPQ
ncbi:MAG: PAS domain-containing sensor histidine kinase [Alphaproteobacteria bacterium]